MGSRKEYSLGQCRGTATILGRRTQSCHLLKQCQTLQAILSVAVAKVTTEILKKHITFIPSLV